MPALKRIHAIASAGFLLCLAFLCAAVMCADVAEASPLMRDFIGINGHTVQFKPDLYQPVCRLVRDYHPVAWDLGENTSELPPFPFARNRVDWSQVYGSWRTKGWNIDACLMFESVKQADWKNVESDAEAYGKAFAQEFGPSGKHKLVDSVEIGNEPGKWSDADYTIMFRAMAEGIRAGDPNLKIVTCNLTTGKSGEYEKSVECVEKSPELFDVLNLHTYAQLEGWPTWRRSFPEDPKLATLSPGCDGALSVAGRTRAGQAGLDHGIWLRQQHKATGQNRRFCQMDRRDRHAAGAMARAFTAGVLRDAGRTRLYLFFQR